MRKRGFISLLACLAIIFSFPLSAKATPKDMGDGQLFDAEFYADTYPDLKNAFGYDEAKLYAHYLQFGKAEGRLPYSGAAVPAAVAAPKTNDLVIGNIDETPEKQKEMQDGYSALPQNVKNYYNSKNIKIYAATRDHIGVIHGRKSLGFSSIWYNDDGSFTSADIYVCGSANSFMPAKYTLYHELGHVLDYGYRYSANWDGWTEMQPYSPTQVYSSGEAFAEAFAGYFERPDKLKKTAPNAYAYIENIINNMH